MIPFIKFDKINHAFVPAVLFSLGMHVAAGAILVFCLSAGSVSAPRSIGIDLVWVSMAAPHASAANHIQSQPRTSLTEAAMQTEAGFKNEDAPANIQESSQAVTVIMAGNIVASGDEINKSGAAILSGHPADSGGEDLTGEAFPLMSRPIAYPLYRENVPPVYPQIARARGYEGLVLISAEILPNGRVGDIKIRKSSGYAILDQSAVQAVKPWKFEPAREGGHPFTAWVELPIKFVLQHNLSS